VRVAGATVRESHRSTNANGRKTFLSFLSVFYLYKVFCLYMYTCVYIYIYTYIYIYIYVYRYMYVCIYIQGVFALFLLPLQGKTESSLSQGKTRGKGTRQRAGGERDGKRTWLGREGSASPLQGCGRAAGPGN